MLELRLDNIRIDMDIHPNIHFFAKLESMNPTGSVKDRMAKYIIENAEHSGLIKKGGTVVENSSGNTGTAFAMMCALKGYHCIITMPDKMSIEKRNLIKSYGAEVVVTKTDVPFDSPESYYSVAKKIASETPNSYYPDQYNNPQNIEAHYKSTGPEIWQQLEGKIDVLIAGAGTGGTISGAGRYLKEKNRNIKLVAVDPIGSVFYDYFKHKKLIKPNVYQVEGIGEDYLVKALDFTIIDDMLQVDDKSAFMMTRYLAKSEGLFCGGSSGAALHAALQYAQKFTHHNISDKKMGSDEKINFIIIFPDSGDRYLSKIFNDSWMKEHGYPL